MADAFDPRTELPALLRSLLPPFAAAAVGSAATFPSIPGWYASLDKPGFTPPRWAFGPAWTTLYTLMGIAHYLVTSRGRAEPAVRRADALYATQLGLNALWSILFFGLRSPLAALVEIVLLWLAIALTVAAFWRVSRPAALLLLPYLLWTAFAAVLNAAIWRRNR